MDASRFPLYPHDPMSPDPVSVLLVGTGFIAGVHATRLVQSGRARIVGVCGRRPGAAAAFITARKLEGAAAGEDFDAMLHALRPRAVYVCIPPDAHTGQVERAARTGAAVFVEKPPGLSAAQVQAMAEAAAGVPSQLGFHMRHRKAVRRTCELLASGKAGAPTLFTGRFWCNFSGAPWWRDVTRSGGQYFEQVIHIYDLARLFLGEPVSASARTANLGHTAEPDYTVEDTSAALLGFASGAMAVVTGSNCAVRDRFAGDWRLVCTGVTVDYRSSGDWRERDEAVFSFADGTVEKIVEDGDPYLGLTEEFLDAVEGRGSTDATLGDSVRLLRVLEAVGTSARANGALIPVSP